METIEVELYERNSTTNQMADAFNDYYDGDGD